MNKKLLSNPYVYPKVVLWWGSSTNETELTLRNRTLKEAYEMALAAGYEPPVWYKPWQYIWGGLGVVTVG
jgi:hypothetical protein